MAIVAQFGIILSISLLGELCYRLVPLPVPASIYGLLLMLLALGTGLVKLRQVEQAAGFLLELLPLLLVPVAVGLMNYWGALQAMLVPFLLITVVGTVVVLAVSGSVTQWLLNRRQGGGQDG